MFLKEVSYAQQGYLKIYTVKNSNIVKYDYNFKCFITIYNKVFYFKM